MKKKKCTAIVLAAGQGKRMGSDVQKQYLDLCGKPVLFYSLSAFQNAGVIDEIILVTETGWETFCQEEFVEKYQLTKVRAITAGGSERYLSVQKGLELIDGEGIVFVHDGARPFVTQEIIDRVYEETIKHKACVVGMPVKDTIKIADEKDYVKDTPDRRSVWTIQTPQVFDTALLKGAYSMLMRESYISVTDDAMVVEQMLGCPIKLVRGSYQNIKITTPEDMWAAQTFIGESGR